MWLAKVGAICTKMKWRPRLNGGDHSRISHVLAGHKFKFVTQLVSDYGTESGGSASGKIEIKNLCCSRV